MTCPKVVGIQKIHAIVDVLGNPLAFLPSPGSDHDSQHAVPLLRQTEIKVSIIIGDKAYGSQVIGRMHYISGGKLCHPAQKQQLIEIVRVKHFFKQSPVNEVV